MKRDLSKMTCIEDLRLVAKRKMPRMFYDYIDSGSWTETTYRENTSDFKDIRFRQKVLVNMEGRSLETKMIGQDVKMPVAIAPTGFTGMAHADGEILAARAAEKFGIPFTLSTMSICSIEDVAENTSAPFWFQLYVMRDREFMENLIKRAKDAKCSALVLTADLQVLGQRHKDIKNGLSAPPKPTIANLINLATKPEWCMKMLNTERRTFRNIVGHAKNVGDLSSLSSWTSEQFDPRLKTRKKQRKAVRMHWSFPTTAAASSTIPYPPSKPCPTSSAQSAATSKCGWTAASAAVKTSSKHGLWAQKAR